MQSNARTKRCHTIRQMMRALFWWILFPWIYGIRISKYQILHIKEILISKTCLSNFNIFFPLTEWEIDFIHEHDFGNKFESKLNMHSFYYDKCKTRKRKMPFKWHHSIVPLWIFFLFFFCYAINGNKPRRDTLTDTNGKKK